MDEQIRVEARIDDIGYEFTTLDTWTTDQFPTADRSGKLQPYLASPSIAVALTHARFLKAES